MKKISQWLDIKNLMLVFLLALMFINFKGYWYAVAVLPILYAVFYYEVYKLYDRIFILIFLFGLWYSVFSPPLANNQYVAFILAYPILYLVGKHIGKTESTRGIINILFILSLSMALVYIASIAIDISQVGFFVDARNIAIIGLSSDTVAATGIYANLMILTIFFIVLFMDIPLAKKVLYVTMAVLALVASVRIQSRTSLVLLLVAISMSLLINIKTILKHNLIKSILIAVLVAVAVNYIFSNYGEELGVINRFMEEDNAMTGGGRLELSSNVLRLIPEHPFGIPYRVPYAHNLWLDCARVAGIVPLLLLIILTIYYINTVWRLYTQDRYSDNFRTIITVLGISMLIFMNVEPILEGCPLLFAFFVLFLGVMRGRALFVNNMQSGYR